MFSWHFICSFFLIAFSCIPHNNLHLPPSSVNSPLPPNPPCPLWIACVIHMFSVCYSGWMEPSPLSSPPVIDQITPSIYTWSACCYSKKCVGGWQPPSLCIPHVSVGVFTHAPIFYELEVFESTLECFFLKPWFIIVKLSVQFLNFWFHFLVTRLMTWW